MYEEKKRKLRIIGITGHAEGSEKMEEVKKIMEDVLVKPVSFESLVIFLEKYIKEISSSENQIKIAREGLGAIQ